MTVAWVTGGGTGIGRALAEGLFRKGAKVVITGRRKDVLDETAQAIKNGQGSGEILAIAGDASDPEHIKHVVSEVQSRFGTITHLFNNAGSNDNRSIRTATPEMYQKAFENNCMSAIRITQEVLPAMQKNGSGAIINISSVYGRWGTATSASYTVSKFAIAGYTEALQQGLQGSGVHVLSVFPGYIRTDMTTPFVAKGSLRERLGHSTEQMANAIFRALERKQRELYYPWYVSWAFRLHRWLPTIADRMAMKVKR